MLKLHYMPPQGSDQSLLSTLDQSASSDVALPASSAPDYVDGPTIVPTDTFVAETPMVAVVPPDEKHLALLAHLANQIRIKKAEISDSNDQKGQLEREGVHLEEGLHHVDQDVRRVEGELVQLELAANKHEGASKAAQVGVRDKDMELRRQGEKTAKLDRDINRLKQEIADRERRVAEIKAENRSLMKSKDELRRKIEIGHGGVRTKEGKAREKEVEIQRAKQDRERKKAEILHMRTARVDRFHSVADNQRETMRMETDLRRIEQEVERTTGELRLIEMATRQEENTAKTGQSEMRSRELAIHNTGDEAVRLGREVDRLKIEIVGKEGEIAKIHGDGEELKKTKEDLRRRYELEHFSANTGFTQAHEKGLQLTRFQQEYLRKKDSIEKNKMAQAQLRHDLMFLEQDLATAEAELRHANGR